MPCNDGGYTREEEARMAERQGKEDAAKRKAAKDKLDGLTRMLCELCAIVEKCHPDGPVNQLAGDIKGLRVWWTEHKRRDEKRKAGEALVKAEKEARAEAKRTKDELRQTAISKLTSAERKALGL